MEFIERVSGKFINDKLKKLDEWIRDENHSTKYFKNISLLNCFDENEETIFFDRMHFTDKGNEIMSKKICASIYNNQSKLFDS